MTSRREFVKVSGSLAVGSLLLPPFLKPGAGAKVKNVGIQLYAVRKEMLADAVGTLKKLAAMGYKQLESARSDKGNYYGLSPKEIKKITADLGMTLRSGHVHKDEKWQQSIDDAAETGQEYIIVSTMPTRGQTIENYQAVADAFSKDGEVCKKSNLKFGYHNHDYEFESDKGKVLYNVLLERTDPALVNMELDLGWVVAGGQNPISYFKKYPGRFPLWHLKDMDMTKKQSTEFGKGGVKIKELLKNAKLSGMKHFFVEQEEYTVSAMESMQQDFDYLKGQTVS